MIKKISMLAVAAAAVSLALTGCVKAPVTGLLDTKGLDGSWSFAPHPVEAEIEGTSVTVTVGTGMAPISMHEDLAAVTKVVVMGTLTEDAEENTFTLMLAEGDSIMVTLAPTVPPAFASAATKVAAGAVKTMVEAAQGETVMITLNSDADPDTLVVQGSFIEALLMAAGADASPMGLMATRIIE